MYTAHIEARIEAAHRNGPPGHKCAGTHPGKPADLERKIEAIIASSSFGGLPTAGKQQLTIAVLLALEGEFDFHGHSWKIEIDWAYEDEDLNEHGWGPVDFGEAKGLIRRYDHHNLNIVIPERIQASAEGLAKLLYNDFVEHFAVAPLFVKVHEGGGNTLTYSEPADD